MVLRLSDEALKLVLLGGLWIAAMAGVITALAGAVSGVAGYALSKRSDLAIADASTAAREARGVAARANERAASLENEAAQARERAAGLEKDAAQAKLDQERLRQQVRWRVLTTNEKGRLIQDLSELRSPVTVNWTSGDAESAAYAVQFAEILRAAGVPVTDVAALFGGNPAYGISVAGTEEEASPLIHALNLAGFHTTNLVSEPPQKLILFIGPKRTEVQ